MECSICFEDYSFTPYITFVCKHSICTACNSRLKAFQHSSCPICREVILDEQLNKNELFENISHIYSNDYNQKFNALLFLSNVLDELNYTDNLSQLTTSISYNCFLLRKYNVIPMICSNLIVDSPSDKDHIINILVLNIIGNMCMKENDYKFIETLKIISNTRLVENIACLRTLLNITITIDCCRKIHPSTLYIVEMLAMNSCCKKIKNVALGVLHNISQFRSIEMPVCLRDLLNLKKSRL